MTHLNFKKRIYLLLFVLCIGSIMFISSHSQLFSSIRQFLFRQAPETIDIVEVTFKSDTHLSDLPLDFNVHIDHSLTTQLSHLYLGASLQDPLGHWIDLPIIDFLPSATNKETITISTHLTDLSENMLITGPYKVIVSIWDRPPTEENATRLSSLSIDDALRIYNFKENFQEINDNIWYSREGQLGRSKLSQERVNVSDGKLKIIIPKGSVDGGELQTTDLVHYGSYEIRMKVPDAPSSITGFFLYKAPDFHHEIDIEIYNQQDSTALFTSYYSGDAYHENKTLLTFDPTKDFYHYRIDYYPSSVSFFINNQLMQTWTEGFSTEPMYLMINTWFPSWLEGLAPSDDQVLEVDWIKY